MFRNYVYYVKNIKLCKHKNFTKICNYVHTVKTP